MMRELASGQGFLEGPVACGDGSVLAVDISNATLIRVSGEGSVATVARLGGGPNGAAIGKDGACYICNNGGFSWIRPQAGVLLPGPQPDDYAGGRIDRVDLATGAWSTIHTHCGEFGLKGPNDLVIDKDGGIWFTDFGKVRDRDMDRGGVYYAAPDGSFIREVIFPMVTPNGIGLSPDGARLYVSETYTGQLWAFEIAGPGQIRQGRGTGPHAGTFIGSYSGFGPFDSMALEANGNICVATLFAGGITVFSPDGGIVEFVPFPDPFTTNICFGGDDMQTAYVTLSSTGRLVETRWARPGLRLNGGA